MLSTSDNGVARYSRIVSVASVVAEVYLSHDTMLDREVGFALMKTEAHGVVQSPNLGNVCAYPPPEIANVEYRHGSD